MNPLSYTSLAILLVIILLAFLFVSTNQKSRMINSSERFYIDEEWNKGVPTSATQGTSPAATAPVNPDAASAGIGAYGPSDPKGNEVYTSVSANGNGAATAAPAAGNCFPRDKLAAEDLLPKDAVNSRWSQMNPSGQGDVSNRNFLTAGYHIGIDTQGSSLKNANLDLRSAPPNPRVAVSPWMISTIEWSDANRRPLEIGGSY